MDLAVDISVSHDEWRIEVSGEDDFFVLVNDVVDGLHDFFEAFCPLFFVEDKNRFAVDKFLKRFWGFLGETCLSSDYSPKRPQSFYNKL